MRNHDKGLDRKSFMLWGLALFWLVFSIGYIVFDMINDFKDQELASVYEKGRIDAGKAVVNQAANCNPFTITAEDVRVELISTQCIREALESAQSSENSATQTNEAPDQESAQ